MAGIKDRLRRAIEVERSRGRPPRRDKGESGPPAEEAFAPVRKAAQDIAAELADLPELRIAIEPETVWVDLYDKHFCFAVDDRGQFVGDELGYGWLEPELNEARYTWRIADECVDALVRACARYVILAHAIRSLQPKPSPLRAQRGGTTQ
jgi:hypothetical protein